jgi:hypothetical protein
MSLGPNVPLANDTAAIVIEKTTPATPTIDPAIIDKTTRAVSVSIGWKPKRPELMSLAELWSIPIVTNARPMDASKNATGMHQ